MGKISNSRKHAVKSAVERLRRASDKVPVLDLASASEIYSVLGLKWPPTPESEPTTSWSSSWVSLVLEKVSQSFEAMLSGVRARCAIGKPSKSHLSCLFFTVLALVFYLELHTIGGFTRFWLHGSDQIDLRSTECTIENSHWAMELFRPTTSCGFCAGIQAADRVSGIAPQEFEYKYAYSGRPVIVTDAMRNWTATQSFSFEFLKSIYGEGSRSLEHDGENCLFFPYSTEFRSLGQVFNMSEQRRTTQHWYIGWSNCDAEASRILRQHYQRPYFLPETAESTHADWLFMGTPGYGAHMHIDHVFLPSWQAQVSGAKRWFLQPPPECYFQCVSFSVDVGPGEIIVLDTNKWYHQTLILPGQMSITIGSEYD